MDDGQLNKSTQDDVPTRVPTNNRHPSRHEDIPANAEWYTPSDLMELEPTQTTLLRPQHDDEDLPDESNVDTVRADIEENYEEFRNFDSINTPDFIYKSFNNLSKEEREKLIDDYRRYRFFMQERKKKNDKEDFEQTKNKKILNLKLFIGYGIATLLMMFIMVFVSLFLYITIKEGTLNDSGIGVGILNTIQEVLKIIFSSGSDML